MREFVWVVGAAAAIGGGLLLTFSAGRATLGGNLLMILGSTYLGAVGFWPSRRRAKSRRTTIRARIDTEVYLLCLLGLALRRATIVPALAREIQEMEIPLEQMSGGYTSTMFQ